MKRLLFVIGFAAAAFATEAQEAVLERVPAKVSVTQSPEQLSQNLDSASNHAYIPFHAKIFEANLGVEDAVRENGDWYWHLRAPDLALKVYLELKPHRGDTLYIYNKTGQVKEKLHSGNLFRRHWVSAAYDEEIWLRYSGTSGKQPDISIPKYSLMLKKTSTLGVAGFGDSDPCEINVNCSESQGYEDVASSVVRIGVKIQSYEGWCTGTLMNNTAYDRKPYILTAEHCGIVPSFFVSPNDLQYWEFYFGYESPDCSTPASEASIAASKLVGAHLVANSDDNGGDRGSDFILLLLSDSVAFSNLHNPYFAGWNRTTSAPSGGVTIHHPQGDIKKISTFNYATSSQFDPSVSGTHWRVHWQATANGHGVTEFGSSGAPIFDTDGLTRGVLTGGSAMCSRPNNPDYYGKFSYSWDQNGTQPNRRLKPWLDPVNSNVLALGGTYRDDSMSQKLLDTNEFSIAPVPVTEGTLLVRGLGANEKLTEFQIFSLDGRLLYQKQSATLANAVEEIDVSNFGSGFYVLRIVRNGTVHKTKFTVIN